MRLENKVAIITGGGTGIGRETALLFAKEGAKVVVTDINEESGSQTVKDLQANGNEAIFIHHDVSNEDDWKKVAKETIDQFGKVDILFNNAGIYKIKPLAEIALDEWNRLMSINVTGVFLGMKHIMPLMAKQKKGSVINASSIAGLMGSPGHVLYGASKGAVRIMTKDAAMEYAHVGVRVNSIHPGYIDTGMADYASEVTGSSKDELGKNLFPLGHLGSVKDVANTVLFLASDESAFSTGAEFVIDGGATAK
ncbi:MULTISPECIES: SDR family NAD(P)-dependent oxidoreductase [Heyndrickxia]|jgi:NAD(P)-dependent dehydrogenase (short-subunit alcohol dehydrogenase family)|uniref:SDR family NAD(P)-dependent oxidoreductase n=1 Tax=Heyndrickxia TaxID=2837504 RepID=UPI0003A7B12C|nr:glucose 1-dehydrogenase [Heyndrickxia oleronia]MCI1589999.1 glucose 1-dehydrogenase [Heyndrickxia oleronia]MCI1613375.1 glucose 1-dehydrogenase [Heyndrickxia oleronia]MCI1744717.1 glucose 1-dehydrogenase [Heyndrickxia oleronia]MCI1761324.1 glucose 1-dehydrogenase [Heyndrickxia oleronia]